MRTQHTKNSIRLPLRAGLLLITAAMVLVPYIVAHAEDSAVIHPNVQTVGSGPGHMNPRYYRAPHVTSFGPDKIYKTWPPAERARYEKSIEWMHQAKYGAMFCFLANLVELPPRIQWTSESWNEMVNSVDVEAFADQCKEAGLGYVILTLGQNCQFACAPNPVIDKYWELEPGQYNATRDLPMDLYHALHKRGIRLKLYVSVDHQYKLPRPASMQGADRFEHWVEALQWYSDHYGTKCSGWWVDGVNSSGPNYIQDVHAALRHGNPNTVIASGNYPASDFIHGHCKAWGPQQKTLPYLGRWDPEYRIQWQALQYLGKTWGHSGVAHSDAAVVAYASNIVSRGGVITFDLGTRDANNNLMLRIPEGHMRQLRLVRDALKDIPATDGAETLQATIQEALLTVRDGKLIINNIWPARWNHTFTLHAPEDTTLKCTVENGVLVELRVTPAERMDDVLLPGNGPDGSLAFMRSARMLTQDGRSGLPPASGNIAQGGLDGDPNTGAEAARQFGWIYEVDLSTPLEINRIKILFHPEHYATAFRVTVSEDRSTWNTVYEDKDADGSPVETRFAPAKARYVRVIADKPDGPGQKGYQMQILELGVYD